MSEQLKKNSSQKKSLEPLEIANYCLVAVGVIAFAILIGLTFFTNIYLCIKISLVCAISFVLVTILRKVLNFERPQIEGAIYSKKAGEAFPSRHTFSLMMIGLSWLNVNVLVGFILCGLTMVLGGIRIAMGAHSVRDVYGAIIIAITCSLAGFLFF
ncbi:MAG: phosphatase PAP2 family protein [Phoenicibacter congonensis]|uniref:Phosphatase PAP2 family protein n=1 Tax=Phoenicibacter congonensis TaxID=1944646 RepID=A0AA43UA58_9ACTN|nr:phosphatase PAP2 family protein [Phoenicibacter congonensis]